MYYIAGKPMAVYTKLRHVLKGHRMRKLLVLCFAMGILFIASGCHISIFASDLPGKFEKTAQLSAPLVAAALVTVKNHNGSIKVEGIEDQLCRINATIRVRARTDSDAQRIAQLVKIKLVPSGRNLNVEIDKPREREKYSLCVDFDITVPGSTSLKLNTHNGTLGISNLSGDVHAKTHNGSVNVSEIDGDVRLHTHNGGIDVKEISGKIHIKTHNGGINIAGTNTPDGMCQAVTHNGSINCRDINGLIDCHTHNGSIIVRNVRGNIKLTTHNRKIVAEDISGDISADTYNGSITCAYATDAPNVCQIKLKTHNGGIDLNAAPNFSAAAKVSTRHGSIHTELPIMVKGKINKNKLTGNIGTGKGQMHLETYNGSIRIK